MKKKELKKRVLMSILKMTSRYYFIYFFPLIFLGVLINSNSHAQSFPPPIFPEKNSICGGGFDEFMRMGWEAENAVIDNLFKISDDDEMEIGLNLFEQFKKEKKVLKNHEFQDEAEAILKKIVQHVDRKTITYSLHIIDDDDINAYATLGGNIYLTTGIIRFVHSLDELAFIIGHEVAHVDKLHTQRKFKKIVLAHNAFEMFRMKEVADVGLFLNEIFTAPFNQPSEFEADIFGLELMNTAGFNPNKSLDFFVKLEKYENKVFLQKLFSTHPYSSERRTCIEHNLMNL